MMVTAVIFAAGRGTRMKELSQTQPKHIISVNERPFLFYLLDNLYLAGFKKIIIVIGYQKEIMKEKLKQWSKLPTEIVEQYQWVPESDYGTLCPIKAVEHLLRQENFVALNGDNLYSVRDLKVFNGLNDTNAVAGLRHSHPEKYGALVLRDNTFLSQVVEKPQQFISDLINVGLYAFTPAVFTAARLVGLSSRGEYEITDAINILTKQENIKVISLVDYWLDFTKPEDVRQVEGFLRQGKL